ncbi:helicase [Aureococcus anophagefferens]|nr:helicase [Aureococcus anophagefferens]
MYRGRGGQGGGRGGKGGGYGKGRGGGGKGGGGKGGGGKGGKGGGGYNWRQHVEPSTDPDIVNPCRARVAAFLASGAPRLEMAQRLRNVENNTMRAVAQDMGVGWVRGPNKGDAYALVRVDASLDSGAQITTIAQLVRSECERGGGKCARKRVWERMSSELQAFSQASLKCRMLRRLEQPAARAALDDVRCRATRKGFAWRASRTRRTRSTRPWTARCSSEPWRRPSPRPAPREGWAQRSGGFLSGAPGPADAAAFEAETASRGYATFTAAPPARPLAHLGGVAGASRERGGALGDTVGFKIRFEDSVTASSKVVFCTVGVLLKTMQSNPLLAGATHVIVDEVHERDVHTDFSLLLVRRLLAKRNDLKVVLMSATVDPSAFLSYFPEAAVVEIPGKTNYPIEEHYLEDILPQLRPRSSPRPRRSPFGDAGALEGPHALGGAARHLRAPPKRKVVVSTVLAETSITVEDVVHVVDAGKARSTFLNKQSLVSALRTTWYAKANGLQRRGRAGRVRPGAWWRLYSSFQHAAMVDYAEPEMVRSPLDELCLEVAALGLGAPEPVLAEAISPPDEKIVRAAVDGLVRLGALDAEDRMSLSPLGRQLARLHVHPVLGKLLLLGELFDCFDVALTVAAGLGSKSPFVCPWAGAPGQRGQGQTLEYVDQLRRDLGSGCRDLLKRGWRRSGARAAARLVGAAGRAVAQRRRGAADRLVVFYDVQETSDRYPTTRPS